MDHPEVERALRTGYPTQQQRIEDNPGEYWDPIKWMKEMDDRYKKAK